MRIGAGLVALSLSTFGAMAHAQNLAPPPAAPQQAAPPTAAPDQTAPPSTAPPPGWVYESSPQPWTTPPSAKPAEPELHHHWYGWQTLAIDGASLTMLVLAASIESGVPAYLAVGGYAFGGPVVHLVHERPLIALADFGIRVGAPIVGALVGVAVEDCSGGGDFCGIAGLFLGGAVGVVAAVAVDAAALAHEEVPAETGLVVRPRIRISRDRADAVLVGQF